MGSTKKVNIEKVKFVKNKYTITITGESALYLDNYLEILKESKGARIKREEDSAKISFKLGDDVADKLKSEVWIGNVGDKGGYLGDYNYRKTKNIAEEIVDSTEGDEKTIIDRLKEEEIPRRIIHELFPKEKEKYEEEIIAKRKAEEAKDISRRKFLKVTGLGVGGAIGATLLGIGITSLLRKPLTRKKIGRYLAKVGNTLVYDKDNKSVILFADNDLTDIVNENSKIYGVMTDTTANFYKITRIKTDGITHRFAVPDPRKKVDEKEYRAINVNKFSYDRAGRWTSLKNRKENIALEARVNIKDEKYSLRLEADRGSVILTDLDDEDKALLTYAARKGISAAVKGNIEKTVERETRSKTKELFEFNVDNVALKYWR